VNRRKDSLDVSFRWDDKLARSRDTLDVLAERAAREYQAANTNEMGFDEL